MALRSLVWIVPTLPFWNETVVSKCRKSGCVCLVFSEPGYEHRCPRLFISWFVIPVLIGRDTFFLHTTGTLGATLLILVMYFAEMFIRDDMPMPLLLHHVITILMGFWGLTLRNELQINQLALFITFSSVEQPLFICRIDML